MRISLLVAACVWLFARSALATKCDETSFEQRLARADVVFFGRALSIDAELATTFAVERVYKGTLPTQVVVHTNRVKYAMLPPASRYLVYAAIRQRDGGSELVVEPCGGSRSEEQASDDLAALESGARERRSEAPDAAVEAPPAPAPVQADAGCAACGVGDGRRPEFVHLALGAALLAFSRRRRGPVER